MTARKPRPAGQRSKPSTRAPKQPVRKRDPATEARQRYSLRAHLEDAGEDIRALKRIRDLCRELHHVVGYLGRAESEAGDPRDVGYRLVAQRRHRAAIQLEVQLERFLSVTRLDERAFPRDGHIERAALARMATVPTHIEEEPLSKRVTAAAVRRSDGLLSKPIELEVPPRMCDRCSGRNWKPSDLVFAAAPVRGGNNRRLLEMQWLCANCYRLVILGDNADH